MVRIAPGETRQALADAVRIGKRLPKIARWIERELQKITGKRVLFSLLVWGDARVQYVSNADREDVKLAIIELMGRWGIEAEELGVPTMPLGGVRDTDE